MAVLAIFSALAALQVGLVGAKQPQRPQRLQVAKYAIGGATSFETLGPSLLKGPCKKVAGKTAYRAVGTVAGINQFNSGQLVVALSDTPMTTAQEKTGISSKLGRLTIPLLLAKHSFFVSGAADGAVKMTAAETYNIFKSGGEYIPVSRADDAGTTLVVKQYWKVANTSFVNDVKANAKIYSTAPFPKTWVTSRFTGKGAEAACYKAAQLRGSITYGQVGICNIFAPGVTGEVLLPNKAGVYTLASQADPASAIPRNPPPPGASWAQVSEGMILQTGPMTPPMVSFIYAFIRKKGLKRAGRNGALGKALLLCAVRNYGSLALSLQFSGLPQGMITENIATVNGVLA